MRNICYEQFESYVIVVYTHTKDEFDGKEKFLINRNRWLLRLEQNFRNIKFNYLCNHNRVRQLLWPCKIIITSSNAKVSTFLRLLVHFSRHIKIYLLQIHNATYTGRLSYEFMNNN